MHVRKEQPAANTSSVSEFLLLNFSERQELQVLYFIVVLIAYLTTVTWNLLIITAVAFDHHLHTPMYVFLMNLAIFDVGSVSVVFPKSMANSVLNVRLISYSGCVAQALLFYVFITSDFFLLTAMAYDRYVAICKPLHYELVMNWKTCTVIVLLVWITGVFFGALNTGCTFATSFCSNIIHQFFCEIPQLIKLNCSSLNFIEMAMLAVQASTEFTGCLFIIASYVFIFTVVLRMPSVQGRKKALSTCLPHFIVCSTLVISVSFAYLRPPSEAPSNIDVAFTMIYAMIPPMLNPIIYSMRNKEIQVALSNVFDIRNLFKKMLFHIVL